MHGSNVLIVLSTESYTALEYGALRVQRVEWRWQPLQASETQQLCVPSPAKCDCKRRWLRDTNAASLPPALRGNLFVQ